MFYVIIELYHIYSSLLVEAVIPYHAYMLTVHVLFLPFSYCKIYTHRIWSFNSQVQRSQIVCREFSHTRSEAHVRTESCLSLTFSSKSCTYKPIFHQKLRLRWLLNAREQETNNMKSTCPTQTQPLRTQRELFHWVALGLAFGIIGSCWAFVACVRGRVWSGNPSRWGPYPT